MCHPCMTILNNLDKASVPPWCYPFPTLPALPHKEKKRSTSGMPSRRLVSRYNNRANDVRVAPCKTPIASASRPQGNLSEKRSAAANKNLGRPKDVEASTMSNSTTF